MKSTRKQCQGQKESHTLLLNSRPMRRTELHTKSLYLFTRTFRSEHTFTIVYFPNCLIWQVCQIFLLSSMQNIEFWWLRRLTLGQLSNPSLKITNNTLDNWCHLLRITRQTTTKVRTKVTYYNIYPRRKCGAFTKCLVANIWKIKICQILWKYHLQLIFSFWKSNIWSWSLKVP